MEAKKSILDISTGHVTLKSREWLDAQAVISTAYRDEAKDEAPISTIAGFGYGWFLTANPSESALERMPEDVKAIVEYARSQRCDYVVLDRDADAVDDLPTYE